MEFARLGSKELEVQHHDCIIFGSSLIYYLFTKNDGGLQQLPVEKQSFAHSATPTHQPIESFIPAIIGEDRSRALRTRADYPTLRVGSPRGAWNASKPALNWRSPDQQ
eukprot:3060504-Amphidinium_carterae.1